MPEEAPKTWPVFYSGVQGVYREGYPHPDHLAQQITPQTAFHKDAWCKQPASKICVKYNYLPAYQIDMEAPPTPKPDHPHPTPGLTPPTASQYADIAYITFAGLVDTMVPAAGSWALVGQSASYIIKLAPLLWWALPSSQQSKLAAKANRPPPGMRYPNTMKCNTWSIFAPSQWQPPELTHTE
ncbi:hypothetical protein DSO57_1026348 [Entomophthora muscae]|uniref:Uncharacterized protein n=1 Tax=Entomophthora muscae TaxID=34485 RepID=A0ACC2RSZ5_9FUNG|nr:hypothetical protein DSO57_1026348 [Entomophthora muscae]